MSSLKTSRRMAELEEKLKRLLERATYKFPLWNDESVTAKEEALQRLWAEGDPKSSAIVKPAEPDS